MPFSFSQPIVSIVMSVYNGARFLDEAISSIRSQTFQNFEFIIVDDGSKDTTREILIRHSSEDFRIRTIFQQNRGLIESLHRGIAETSGQYIARMDADDVAMRERLELQIQCLDSNPSIAVVGGAVDIIDANSKVVNTIRQPSDPDEVRRDLLEKGCIVYHPTVLIRRSSLKDVGGFRRAYMHAEDYDLWLRILEKYEIVNLDRVVLGYRRHAGSISYKHAEQQALSALCARTTASLRLQGHHDWTTNLDLVTNSVLVDLGISQESINEAVFSHMLAVTKDVIQCGVFLAGAEFPKIARPFATTERLRTATIKLNRTCINALNKDVDKQKHRIQLLADAPEVYWELFGAEPSNAGSPSSIDSESLADSTYGVDMQHPTLDQITKQHKYFVGKGEEMLRDYERICRHMRDVPIAMLLLGIDKLDPLLLWKDYFTCGNIYGVVQNQADNFTETSGRVHLLQGNRSNPAGIIEIASETGQEVFNFIIDRGSEDRILTGSLFRALFYTHLRPGGFYSIEGWDGGPPKSLQDASEDGFPDISRSGNPDSSGTFTHLGIDSLLKLLIGETDRLETDTEARLKGRMMQRIRSIHISRNLVIFEKAFE